MKNQTSAAPQTATTPQPASFVGRKAERAASQAIAASLPLQQTLARMLDEKLLPRQRVMRRLDAVAIKPSDVAKHGSLVEAMQAILIANVFGDIDRFVSWTFDDVATFLYVAGVCAPLLLDLEKAGDKTLAKTVRGAIELLKNHPAIDIDPKHLGAVSDEEIERQAELWGLIKGVEAEPTPVNGDATERDEYIAVLRSFLDPQVFGRAVRAGQYLHGQVAQSYGLAPKRFFSTIGAVWAQEAK